MDASSEAIAEKLEDACVNRKPGDLDVNRDVKIVEITDFKQLVLTHNP